jgi:membrane-bound lytic murein transglycosylase D
MNDQVEKALTLFKGRERKFFLDAYQRSGRYRHDIVTALREAGMPEELSWLPLIESGFKVRALSRARALGMWQFIASTGYRFGLKRDTWVDERMDPEKSTQAAIAYLTELHNIFGDWITALAAYNCGAGRVLNRIKSQKINYLDNFWDLYHRLPRETAFYVPKFLAVLHIVNNPEAHGFVLPEVDAKLESEEVTINKQVHLKTVASRLKVSYTSLKDLNPELRQNLTPSRPYTLKIPVGKGEALLAMIKDIPVYKPPVPPYVVHRVRYGESLSVIAEKYHTSVTAIMNMNGLTRRNYVKVGWRLKIPTKKGYVQSSYLANNYKGSTTNYIVRKGDSLWKIANRYQTTVISIKTINNLHNSELQIGQVLKIPAVETISLSGNTKSYTVRRGDSPYLIARRYRMNLHDFLQMNNLTPKSKIFPGQLVLVTTK